VPIISLPIMDYLGWVDFEVAKPDICARKHSIPSFVSDEVINISRVSGDMAADFGVCIFDSFIYLCWL